MSSRLFAISFDAHQPEVLARFWSGLLGAERTDDPYGGVSLLSGNDAGYRLGFRPTRAPKTAQNRAHFDLTSSSPEDQRRTVAVALDLGARRADVGQGPDASHVVLADPEGNEFCVLEPGNGFLAGCGLLGALACDGTRAVGRFWSRALGWPLVWDQDEETAIQSPDGGTKITWGGPPLMPDAGKDLRFDLMADDDLEAEVERLLSLGAERVAAGESGESGGPGEGEVVLADPDGNEFRLLARR
ncbi:VOC family protein [Streptomyces rochei]|uniref:VOC family protein n=1 Tax=Streptomyces rochei TaxID=1928 RepID=UPI0034083FEB